MGVTKRARELPAFIAMDVLERAKELQEQGRSIVHLEVGEPDFDTPEAIIDAAVAALRGGDTHYTHSCGILDLREAVSQHYRERYGVKVEPNRILITSGTSPGMLLMFNALLESGDEVIISDPCYACYDKFISFSGGVPVRVPVSDEDAFQFRPKEIKARLTSRTKAILINSPANPTGQLLSAERIKAIAELAPGADGPPYVISDEIYHGLSYEGEEHSILEYTDTAFALNGFSKLYAMTGWRLGYLICPERYMRPLQKMHQNFAICAPSMAQRAGIAALTGTKEDTARMVEKYNQRRKLMVAGLKELGFGIKVEPTGAFYVFARCDFLDPDDYRLAFDILEKAGVACTPGRDFGPGGHGFLRFSYASSVENIKEGIERLGRYIKERQG